MGFCRLVHRIGEQVLCLFCLLIQDHRFRVGVLPACIGVGQKLRSGKYFRPHIERQRHDLRIHKGGANSLLRQHLGKSGENPLGRRVRRILCVQRLRVHGSPVGDGLLLHHRGILQIFQDSFRRTQLSPIGFRHRDKLLKTLHLLHECRLIRVELRKVPLGRQIMYLFHMLDSPFLRSCCGL